MLAPTNRLPINDANRLGLDYAALAAGFAEAPTTGSIVDVHTHIGTPASARAYLRVADLYGIRKAFTMTGLENVQALRAQLTPEELERIEFMCVPDYGKREAEGTFITQWLKDIEAFRGFGCRVIKYWCGPRGRDFIDGLPGASDNPFVLDSPIRKQGMKLAYELGYRVFMTHTADPDTWFQTTYADSSRYGTKLDQYKPLEAAMDQYDDVTWIGAHTAGYPEDLDFVQKLLDRHPNFVVDISACKWQVRELGKQPERFKQFVQENRGRVLFGTDIVTNDENNLPETHEAEGLPSGFDLYASRFWAFRTMIETDYDGMSPIVDPDYVLLDPNADPKQTATMRGASIGGEDLEWLYHKAAERVFEPVGGVLATPTI